MQTTSTDLSVATVQAYDTLNATTALQLHYRLQMAVLADRNSSLVVDLGQAASIDSANLMALVSALKFARRLNKPFALSSVSPAIQMILEMTQLDRVFEIVEEAGLAKLAA